MAVGDLIGIAERLGYIASLGVDAIWISPFFTSPMKDFGYDVSDYTNVDPMFGTLGDFDHLVKVAHEHGIRVIIDLVMSHSSDQHPWFVESRASRDNPKSEWYVWAEPKPDGNAAQTTGCRSSADRPGSGTASVNNTTCTISSRRSPT